MQKGVGSTDAFLLNSPRLPWILVPHNELPWGGVSCWRIRRPTQRWAGSQRL